MKELKNALQKGKAIMTKLTFSCGKQVINKTHRILSQTHQL